MKFNKKGQNITKPYTIIFVIVVLSILSVSLMDFGRDIASNPNNKLDAKSIDTIYSSSGYTASVNKSKPNDADDLFYSSEINTSGNLKDYALEFEFYREQSSSIRTILQDLWNMPAYFVSSLGLDLSEWETVLLLFNTIIWLLIFYGIYRAIRGSI